MNTIPSFDEALDAHENGGDKSAQREETKLAKMTQIQAKKSSLKTKIMKQKNTIKKSFFDPHIDTVQAMLDLEVLEHEMTICEKVEKALFPEQ